MPPQQCRSPGQDLANRSLCFPRTKTPFNMDKIADYGCWLRRASAFWDFTNHGTCCLSNLRCAFQNAFKTQFLFSLHAFHS
mmetsp:Transcript_42055/g.97362  ORF Transcript_42055/g.97362 Transcript_42055/m.97362 type:complete len:81 (+) Transcript_42055:253-495(+)